MTDRYLVVVAHADHLASGRPVGNGERLPASAVDPEDPHDQAMLEDGRLVDFDPPKPPKGAELKKLRERAKALGVDDGTPPGELADAIAVTEQEFEQVSERARELDIDPDGKTVPEIREAINQAEADADAPEVNK